MIRSDIIKSRDGMGDRNACVVIAWAEIFGCSFEKAFAYLQDHGRKYRRGMFNKDIESAMRNVVSFKVEKLPYSEDNRVSITKFVKNHPVGRYFVLVRGHALCIKDGVVFDNIGMTNRRQVIGAWKIEEKE